MISPTIVGFLVILIVFVLFNRARPNKQLLTISKKYGCEPARDVWRPFFGIPEILRILKAINQQRIFEYSGAYFTNYGHTFSQTTIGRSTIWTDEPTNVKAILSDQFKSFEHDSDRHRAFIPLMGKGIFTSDGKEWAHFRATMRPTFTKGNMTDFDMFERHVQNLISRIPKDGSTFDIQDLFTAFTMDTATDSLFGYSANSLLHGSDPEIKAFADAFAYGLSRISPRIQVGPMADYIPDAKWDKSCETVRNFVDKLVAKAMASRAKALEEKSTRYVYLHEVANSTSSVEELRGHALAILIAGRDTTAVALSFVFYLLARNPEAWQKLCAEVAELNGEIPTAEEVKRMKYTNQVILESLRLFPPIPFNTRKAVADAYLPLGGGSSGDKPIAIQNGTIVFYSVFHMHRRIDIWGKDANEFRPERFEGAQPGPEFVPFNAGPRICIGQGFALTEIAYTVARLVQTYSAVENRDPGPWLYEYRTTLNTHGGVLIGLVPREK